jgi:hypothetical protein
MHGGLIVRIWGAGERLREINPFAFLPGDVPAFGNIFRISETGGSGNSVLAQKFVMQELEF